MKSTNFLLPRIRHRLVKYCSNPCTSHIKKPMLIWPRKEYGISTKLFELERYWKEVAQAAPTIHPSRPKKYILSMYPYPSGKLHMGHMRVYTISDTLARYYRLNGYNVIHPIGWDAFGLPAENAAREGISLYYFSNIDVMRQQLLSTGIIFDWNREISTCSTDYYRWTQWIFCRLFERGLVRRALTEVHWDPIDCTVLAAEQIDAEGRSWRSGAIAEKRKMKHWMIETPKYAKRMYDGLEKLTHWKEVAAIQANWIGKCDVWRFLLPLKEKNGTLLGEKLDLRIRDPHHLATASVVFIQSGHPLFSLADEKEEIGVLKMTALNIITGKDMHIIFMNENAAKNGNEFILNARLPCNTEEFDKKILESFGFSTERSQITLSNNDVIQIAEFGDYGGYQTSEKLLDWVVSRQRKWGTPIPVLLSADDQCAVVVTDDQLPVIAAHCKYDEKIPCQKLPNGFGYWEKDTLDTFFDSSWYYLRFLDPMNDTELISKKKLVDMPVDVYVGGIEHAALHLFFARFISYFLYDIGVSSVQEPFDRLLPQGIVCSRTFKRSDSGKYLKEDDVVQTGNGFIVKKDGSAVVTQFEKMSKSKHNGVDPLSVLKMKGIDLTRLQLLNEAAPREPINWGDTELKGLFKFMERTSDVVSFYVEQRALAVSASPELLDIEEEKRYRTIYNFFVRNISMVIEVLHLHNTAVDHLQAFAKLLKKTPAKTYHRSEQVERCVHALVIMLQLFTPHLAAEYWAALRSVPALNSHAVCLDKEINEQPWPQIDPDANIDFMINVGKLSCGRVEVPRLEVEHLSNEEALQYAINGVHNIFFQELSALGFRPVSCKKLSRAGFYVCLEVKFNNIPPEKTLLEILKQTRAQRLKAKRARKKARAQITSIS
ncbi:leucine--tRNA ligase domain protein [Onchocerca flexuosa]|uniref:leucine--tRNA ligase n=1 Tax=Onchocerca flexuosa TaxID=387005 RepID=A0A238C4H7_9BILA|nr:leucine--tRNA ligase domain protein [Onchocerca flexuosa]